MQPRFLLFQTVVSLQALVRPKSALNTIAVRSQAFAFRLFIVCSRQTMICSRQTMVCCRQTMVCCRQMSISLNGVARKSVRRILNPRLGTRQ